MAAGTPEFSAVCQLCNIKTLLPKKKYRRASSRLSHTREHMRTRTHTHAHTQAHAQKHMQGLGIHGPLALLLSFRTFPPSKWMPFRKMLRYWGLCAFRCVTSFCVLRFTFMFTVARNNPAQGLGRLGAVRLAVCVCVWRMGKMIAMHLGRDAPKEATSSCFLKTKAPFSLLLQACAGLCKSK